VFLRSRFTAFPSYPDVPDPGLPSGIIAAIVIAAVLFFCLLVFGIFWGIQRQRELERMYQENPNDPIVRSVYLNNRFGRRRTTDRSLAAIQMHNMNAIQMQNMNAIQNSVNVPGSMPW
jgi:hypothetical protein